MKISDDPSIDKLAWTAGPWVGEPDRVEWVDEVTDLPCLILRSPLGSLCGYVGVDSEHPLHGMSYCDKIERLSEDVELHEHVGPIDLFLETVNFQEGRISIAIALKVHGSVSFSGSRDGFDEWFFGFDCGHFGDVSPAMLTFMPSMRGHGVYRDLAYVQAECRSLAEQLHRLA